MLALLHGAQLLAADLLLRDLAIRGGVGSELRL